MNDTIKAALWLLLFIAVVFLIGTWATGCTPIPATDPNTGQVLRDPAGKVIMAPPPADQIAMAIKAVLDSQEANSWAAKVPWGQTVLLGFSMGMNVYLEWRRRVGGSLTRRLSGALEPAAAERILK